MTDLGTKLKELRLQNGLSLRKAQEKIGLSHNYIRKLELGYDPVTKKKVSPTIDALKMIANGYNISAHTLFTLTLDSGIEEVDSHLVEVPIVNSLYEKRKLIKNRKTFIDFANEDSIFYEVTTDDFLFKNICKQDLLLLNPSLALHNGDLVLRESKIAEMELYEYQKMSLKSIKDETFILAASDKQPEWVVKTLVRNYKL